MLNLVVLVVRLVHSDISVETMFYVPTFGIAVAEQLHIGCSFHDVFFVVVAVRQ